MNDHMQFEDTPASSEKYKKLAHWLDEVLHMSPQGMLFSSAASEDETQLELLLGNNYHLHFYQQLPDFIMALLSNDARATIHFAPLLYHLASCGQCHHGYLELYDAIRFAISPQQGTRPMLGQGTRTLAATPQRMLGHLSETLISQAEALLRQARHDHSDADAIARSLLHLAIRMSSHIGQSMLRRQALHDLVRVATLFEGPSAPQQPDSAVRSYTPILAGAGGMRRGRKIVRHASTLAHPDSSEQESPMIKLQSHGLEGRVVQLNQMLELHLYDLDASLRGQYVTISILLGSLLDPVRWLGGNPRTIRSSTPVDAAGTLITPLGQTDLHLSNLEEHNLLETTFLLLEVRVAG